MDSFIHILGSMKRAPVIVFVLAMIRDLLYSDRESGASPAGTGIDPIGKA